MAENDAGRARLEAMIASLSDEDLGRPIGDGGWTVGVGLMHLAFWDRNWLAKFEEWERTGVVKIPDVAYTRDLFNGINDAMAYWWRSAAPAQVRHEVLAAAEAIDAKAGTLSEPVVAAILAERPGPCRAPRRAPE
jgi:acyl-homoserine lactone acylase PvdQ